MNDAAPAEGFRLSPQQRRVFALAAGGGAGAFVAEASVHVRGGLDESALRHALAAVVARHEILRTTFPLLPGTALPVQVVGEPGPASQPSLELRERGGQAPGRSSAFDDALPLECLPGFEVVLAWESADRARLRLRAPAVRADAATLVLLVEELATRCGAGGEGALDDAFGEALQYADLADWQNSLLEAPELAEGRAFWRDARARAVPAALPGRNEPGRAPDGSEARAAFAPRDSRAGVDGAALSGLRDLAERCGGSLAALLLAAWQSLLRRHGVDGDVAVVLDGRQYEELDRAFGPFARAVPFACRFAPGAPLQEAVASVRDALTECAEKQEYFSWEDDGASPRVAGAADFMPCAFAHQRLPDAFSAGRTTWVIDGLSACQERFELSLEACEEDDALALALRFDPDCYPDAVATALLGHYRGLLEQLAGGAFRPDRPLADAELLTDADRQRWVTQPNDTEAAFPTAAVHERFEAQAARTPDRVAVSCGDVVFSYAELDARAGRLARRLRDRGVGPDVLVGILAERSIAQLVGVLGVLKAGGAYLPLEPELPDRRLAQLLDDARPALVVTQNALRHRPAAQGASVLLLDAADGSVEPPAADTRSERWTSAPARPDQLAYAIYTSGSTGRPKGALITHGGLANYLSWCCECYAVSEGAGTSVHSPLGFDLTVTSLLAPLTVGQRVRLQPPNADAETLSETWTDAEDLSLLKLTPAHLDVLAGELDGAAAARLARRLVVGGEALVGERLDFWRTHAPSTRVVNEYGPTETVVGCCVHEVVAAELPDGPVPIGRPAPNCRLYVLDAWLRPVPPGVAGELYIGGAQVARGYLGMPALTAERFVPDPFARQAGGRLYRTGDLARLLPDGNLEYLGRRDDQVKIRGHRVELGEIEAVLAAHESVSRAAVAARGEPGATRLVAYVTGPAGPPPVPEDLQTFLSDRLPGYMVPAQWVVLDALPLTRNGKVDRRALAALDTPQRFGGVAPRSAREVALADIWSGVLGLDSVGVTDDFFQLGGDSIVGIQIIARAKRAGLVLTPKQLFDHPTVAELAVVARSAGAGVAVHAEQGPVSGDLPLTPIQHWFLDADPPLPHHFNQSILLNAPRNLPAGALEKLAVALLNHHDALRGRFARDGAQWRAAIAGPETDGSRAVVRIDLSGKPPAQRRAALEEAARELQGSLDLADGPLFRIAFFDLGDDFAEDHEGDAGAPGRLLLIAHHLAIDGVSWRMLLEDLGSAFEQLRRGEPIALPEKTASVRQWALRLAEHARSDALRRDASFWLVEGGVPEVAAAEASGRVADAGNGPNTVGSVRVAELSFDEADSRALVTALPAAYRARADDVLLAAWSKAWFQWCGEAAMTVAVEGHGRDHPFEELDVSRTVGWFTAVHPARLCWPCGADSDAALRGIKEQLRRAPQGGFSYGALRYLAEGPEADVLRASPEPVVSFNYLGRFAAGGAERPPFAPAESFEALAESFALAREDAGPTRPASAPRRHLLELGGVLVDGRLRLTLRYSENVHSRARIDALVDAYRSALGELLAHARRPGIGGPTPSDFPLARLDAAALERLVADCDVADLYPLAPVQQGLLFHALLDPAAGVYVEQFNCSVRGALDTEAFRSAWQQLVERHAILRTSFHWEGLARPLQRVARAVTLPWELLDWRGESDTAQAERFAALLAEDRARGFELGRAPLLRLTLIRLGDEHYRFLWTHHHLLHDGWCLPILLREVLDGYEAARAGAALAVEPPRPYRDFIAWLGERDRAEAEAFWRAQLRGFRAPTPLAEAPAALGLQAFEAGHRELETRLSPQLVERLRAVARGERLTLNTLVQGAWALAIARFSGERDVVFGAAVSGRPAALTGVDAMIGLFINTLPVRATLDDGAELLPWLRALQERQLAARDFEWAPLVDIQQWSELPPATPLFESILVFENYPLDPTLADRDTGLAFERARTIERTHYPLSLLCMPVDGLLVRAGFETARIGAGRVRALLAQFERVLERIAAGDARRVGEAVAPSDAERARLLFDWNDTAAALPSERGVHQAFAAQAARTPDAVALRFREERVRYGALDARADALARELRARGVGRDCVVGLCAERSVELVVGMLGIWKAGGAFAPLDPEAPRGRSECALDDAGATLVVTHGGAWREPPGSTRQVLEVAAAAGGPVAGPPTVAGACSPDQLAYVLSTSGSTGRPKGVMVSHRALANHMAWMASAFPLARSDRVLQKTPLTFDASLWEFLAPLLCGAALVIAEPGAHRDPAALVDALRQHGITTLQMVPTALALLVDEPGLRDCTALARLFSGGEPLPAALAARWRAVHGAELVNLYGPTEVCIDATAQVCATPERDAASEAIAVGRPVANVRAYVANGGLELAPEGVAGELYLAGAQLARGYAHRPDLTAERFLPNPFASVPGERLYRTGDRARWRADGTLELLGRVDDQTKLRGHRVEPGEVAAVLREHPSVREAVVAARDDLPGGLGLVAYLTSADRAGVSIDALRAFADGRLPSVMRPAAFVLLDALPVLPNGKLDRRALPAPERDLRRRPPLRAPQSPAEWFLAGLWCELLGLDAVGADDDFFALGGHSLLAMQLVARLRRALPVSLPLRAIFESPTLAAQAAALEASLRGETEPEVRPALRHEPLAPGESLPLSFAQQRLWFLDQLEPGNPFYNFPAAIRLRGPLDVGALERSLREIVERHAVLRTRLVVERDEPRQLPDASAALVLEADDWSQRAESEREAALVRRVGEEARRPFDLRDALKLRAKLIRLGDCDHALLFTMHHIACDGWSVGVLVRELSALYAAYTAGEQSPLPPLPIQYGDYARWERGWLRGPALDAQLAWWRERLEGAPSEVLPTDRPRPAREGHASASEIRPLSGAMSERIDALAAQESATPFMVLLAAYQALLHRTTGATDVAIGTDSANRGVPEVEPLIGFFINLLVVRGDLAGNPSFRALIARTRETALDAFAHRELPFDRLVQEIQPERQQSVTPLFQLLFVLQNTPLEPLALRDLTLEPLISGEGPAKFDLALFVSNEHGHYVTHWKYKTELFEAETVARLATRFEALLAHALAEPDTPLSRLALRTDTARERGAPQEAGMAAEDRGDVRQQRRRAKLAKLRAARATPLDLAAEPLVASTEPPDGATLPLRFEPAVAGVDLTAWAVANCERIEADLVKHGALLFRGFGPSIVGFERFAETVASELYTAYGDLPPEAGTRGIYGSTPYPADQTIEFHSESSHFQSWPRKILFMCVTPACARGETPVVDCRRIYARLDPALRRRFEAQHLLYVRNFIPGLDVPWQRFFGTDDRNAVEAACREKGMELAWRDDGGLRTRNRAPAVAVHPTTGQRAFFNQIQLHHASCLPDAYRDSTREMFSDEDLPRNVFFGDGQPIPDAVVDEIRALYAEEAVALRWERGDIALLDNMLVAHGRAPFEGERKLVVALGQLWKWSVTSASGPS